MTTTNDTTSNEETNTITAQEQGNINYDAINLLNERLAQVSAMLSVCGSKDFSLWCDEIRENYFWACSALVEQAKNNAEKINLRTEK